MNQPKARWVHWFDKSPCDSEILGTKELRRCLEHDLLVEAAPAPEAYTPSVYPEGTHRDDMLPADALWECHDLWASGAWREENARADLDEVMEHLGRLLGKRQ